MWIVLLFACEELGILKWNYHSPLPEPGTVGQQRPMKCHTVGNSRLTDVRSPRRTNGNLRPHEKLLPSPGESPLRLAHQRPMALTLLLGFLMFLDEAVWVDIVFNRFWEFVIVVKGKFNLFNCNRKLKYFTWTLLEILWRTR